MGACMSQAKSMAAGIDKEAVEMGVKGRKVHIAQRVQDIATRWREQIAGGQTVSIAQAEVLPMKDVTNIKLALDGTSSQKDLLTTALYVATNTIYRDQAKKEIWLDCKAGMEKQKLPAAVITHGEKGVGPMADMAFDKLVVQMEQAIREDRPLVNDEDVRAVQAYEAKHPKLAAAPGDAKLDAKPVDAADVKVDTYGNNKESGVVDGGVERGRFEQNQQIRATA